MTLTCPDPPNMAAVAKQLHATALQAESEIYVIEQLMRSAVNLPTVVLTSTAAKTGMGANIEHDLGFSTWATTFDNTAGGAGDVTGTFGPDMLGGFTAFLGEGLYEVGLCGTFVASGAVDDNSVRFIYIDLRRPDPTAVGGELTIQRTGYTLFETNTGVGTVTSFVAHMRARPGDRFGFFLIHGNTSSTMNMNTGAIIWASKLSESSLTRLL